MRRDGVSGLPEALASLPAAARPFVVIRSPLGNAVIDALAPAEDSQTQAILQALGIEVEVRLGPPPADVYQAPSLPMNLGWLALGAVALFVLARGRR